MSRKRFFEDSDIYRRHYLEEVPQPRLAILDTSSLCNLKCPMCPRTVDESPSGPNYANLDRQVLEQVRNSLPNFDEVVLSWIGEPLVNTRLIEIVRFVKRCGPRVHLTTNGVLLTRQRIDSLIDEGLDSLAVSIDGASPDTYRKIRVGAELEQVCRNVRDLIRVKKERGVSHPRVSIAFVAMPDNFHELPDMVPLVRNLGVDLLTIDIVDDFTLPDVFPLGDSALGEMKDEAAECLRRTRQEAAELGVELSYPSVRLFHEVGEWPLGNPIDPHYFRNDYSTEELERKGLRKGCGLPWAHVVIGYNGDVHPCCVSSRVLGNVLEESLDQIWQGEKYQDFRARLKSTNPPKECRNCRRAIWNGSTPLQAMQPWIEVEKHEVYGRGWGPMGKDGAGRAYRPINGEATLFLENSRQPYLTLLIAPGSWSRSEGRVLVDGQSIGRFAIAPGWHKIFFKLPVSQEPHRSITIIHESKGHELLFHSARLMEGGVVLMREKCRNTFWELLSRVRLAFSQPAGAAEHR